MSEQKVKTYTQSFSNQDGDEVEVITTQFLGFRGVKLQTKLLRLVLPLLSGVKSLKGGLQNMDLDTGAMVQHIMQNVTEGKVVELVKELVSTTTAGGKDLSNTGQFDLVIAGNYQLLFSIIKFVIDKNNFFGEGGIGGMLKNLDMMKIPQE